MSLFLGTIVGGIATGLLYALLGFSVILLYRTTGVANFAAGIVATLGCFIALKFHDSGMEFHLAVLLAAASMLVVGAIMYLTLMRPNDNSERLNLTVRTFGIYLLLLAFLAADWAQGEPFVFPSILPTGAAFELSGLTVTWLTVGTLAIAGLMIGCFAVFFRKTRTGLAMLGLAEKPDVARLLGVRTRRLTMLAWAITTIVALLVGLLVAPESQLSAINMDPYLILALSAAVIGGLHSLYGVVLAGVVLGVLDNVISLYLSDDLSSLVIYAFLLGCLIVWPGGWFGARTAERL